MELAAPAVTPPYVIRLAARKSPLAILVERVHPVELKPLHVVQVLPAELKPLATQLLAAALKRLAPLHAELQFMFVRQYWTN